MGISADARFLISFVEPIYCFVLWNWTSRNFCPIFNQNLMMKNFLTAFSLLFLFATNLVHAQLTNALANDLQEELRKAVDNNIIKGVSAAVVLPNGDVWEGAYGLAGGVDSLTTDHHLYSGSTTKTFVAATIMQLQEEGLLSLDDTLGMYVGPFTNIASGITIKQLLTHTSGIYNYTNSDPFFEEVFTNSTKSFEPEEILAYVESPSALPNTQWEYSNTNYILLSMIIEAVSQDRLEDVFRSRHITPLGFETMFLGGAESAIGDYGGMYFDTNGDGSLNEFSAFNTTALLTGAWGAGAMATTPKNLAQWVKKLYGTPEVVSSASLDLMKTGTIFNPSYGLGTVIGDIDNCSTLGHGGGIIHSTRMDYLTDEDFSIVMIVNSGGYNFSNYDEMVRLVKAALMLPTNELGKHLDPTIYPNPFTDALVMELELNGSPKFMIDVYDNQGRKLIHAVEIEAKTQGSKYALNDYIPLNTIPTGLLHIRVSTEKEQQSFSVIRIE